MAYNVYVLPIIRRVRADLGSRRPSYRLELVERACIQAYQAHREQLVNDRILSTYGTDLETYRGEGVNFGAQECARINSRIESVEVGVDFIIYGYDDLNFAHLFTLHETVDPPFEIKSTDRDQDGIAVIGCGDKYALASLLSSELPIRSQAEMLCRVCEAKFEAEKDKDVGRDSAAGVVNKPRSSVNGTSESFIALAALQAIRDAHIQGQDRPYPKELLNALMYCINSNITTERMAQAVFRAEQEIIEENRRRRAKGEPLSD